jgi:seryl-tRNA synthetase
METRISMSHISSEKLADLIVSKLIYSVENIEGCRFDKETNEIVVDHSSSDQRAEIEIVARQLMFREQSYRAFSTKILKSNLTEVPVPNLHEDLSNVYSPNHNVKRGIALQLYDSLNELLQKVASKHTVDKRKYSSLIATKDLKRCGYIRSFPQNLFMVSEFPHQLESLDQVKEVEKIDSIARQSQFTLSTATCMHFYAELADSEIVTPLVITADSNCFRHEAPWRLSNYRLNEFAMKEIVVIGEPTFVEAKRHELIEEVWELFCEMGLSGKIETASDLFYYSDDTGKSQHQVVKSLKYELIAVIRSGTESFSIASFNNTRSSLVNSFGITDPSNPNLHSGCIAFGLDRWVYAILSSFGSVPSSWPYKLRELLL